MWNPGIQTFLAFEYCSELRSRYEPCIGSLTNLSTTREYLTRFDWTWKVMTADYFWRIEMSWRFPGDRPEVILHFTNTACKKRLLTVFYTVKLMSAVISSLCGGCAEWVKCSFSVVSTVRHDSVALFRSSILLIFTFLLLLLLLLNLQVSKDWNLSWILAQSTCQSSIKKRV